MKPVLSIIGAVIFAALPITSPSALEYKHIAGKWCIAGLGMIEFTPTEMILHFEKTGERRVNIVTDYRDDGDIVTVYWRNIEKRSFARFGDLRAGDTKITQLPTEDGPAREMERCIATLRVKPSLHWSK